MKNLILLLVLVFSVALITCKSEQIKEIGMPEDINKDLSIIANSRIFFGHQSVGRNILQGFNDIAVEHSINLAIVDLNNSEILPEFFIAHANVGSNRNPNSKCNDFAKIITENLADKKIQIALLKFCYVDVNAESDVNAIFNLYRTTVDSLKKSFPTIKFINTEVPLKSRSVEKKAKLKQLFGITDKKDEDNIKRNEYNALLRKQYSSDSVFNLAEIESTYPDGSRASFKKDGKLYYSLIRDYSDDGGHLNRTGRKLVAAKLIQFIAHINQTE